MTLVTSSVDVSPSARTSAAYRFTSIMPPATAAACRSSAGIPFTMSWRNSELSASLHESRRAVAASSIITPFRTRRMSSNAMILLRSVREHARIDLQAREARAAFTHDGLLKHILAPPHP